MEELMILESIETAPKNGTHILLFHVDLNGTEPTQGFYDSLNSEWCNDVRTPLITPTHWVHLK